MKSSLGITRTEVSSRIGRQGRTTSPCLLVLPLCYSSWVSCSWTSSLSYRCGFPWSSSPTTFSLPTRPWPLCSSFTGRPTLWVHLRLGPVEWWGRFDDIFEGEHESSVLFTISVLCPFMTCFLPPRGRFWGGSSFGPLGVVIYFCP